VRIEVKASAGTQTQLTTDRAEYYYPHEIPDLKAQSLKEINRATKSISGDAATVFTKRNCLAG
jgi:hypothetical protein